MADFDFEKIQANPLYHIGTGLLSSAFDRRPRGQRLNPIQGLLSGAQQYNEYQKEQLQKQQLQQLMEQRAAQIKLAEETAARARQQEAERQAYATAVAPVYGSLLQSMGVTPPRVEAAGPVRPGMAPPTRQTTATELGRSVALQQPGLPTALALASANKTPTANWEQIETPEGEKGVWQQNTLTGEKKRVGGGGINIVNPKDYASLTRSFLESGAAVSAADAAAHAKNLLDDTPLPKGTKPLRNKQQVDLVNNLVKSNTKGNTGMDFANNAYFNSEKTKSAAQRALEALPTVDVGVIGGSDWIQKLQKITNPNAQKLGQALSEIQSQGIIKFVSQGTGARSIDSEKESERLIQQFPNAKQDKATLRNLLENIIKQADKSQERYWKLRDHAKENYIDWYGGPEGPSAPGGTGEPSAAAPAGWKYLGTE